MSEVPGRLPQPRRDASPTPPEVALRELDEYVQLTAIDPEPGFADRVMAAVEAERLPRRGLMGWLGAAEPGRRFLQATILAGAALVIIAGLILGGSFFEVLRPHPGSSVVPIVSGTPSPAPTRTFVPSPRASTTPSPSPSLRATPLASRPATRTPRPSASATDSHSPPEASHSEAPASSSDGTSSGGPGPN